MGSISWENPDYSFLPHDEKKKASKLEIQDSGSCPKCC